MYPFFDPKFGFPMIGVSFNTFEDKINPSSVETNNVNKNILYADIAPIISVQEDPISNIEINDPFEDKIKIEEVTEKTDCVFNDMRRDRYMIRHQDLM